MTEDAKAMEEGFGPPEKAYVENAWYDGPRAGVADVGGAPHYYASLFDETRETLDTFVVWPIDRASLALEIEQWRIFVEWDTRIEAGVVPVESHPGSGGNPRWNEIDALLQQSRKPPDDARRFVARMEWRNDRRRYALDGPDYDFRWREISPA
jgi:hypothetical protein